MHPLIARIHPAFRTALFAWLLSRGALWLTIGSVRPTDLGGGAPLPGLINASFDHLTAGISAGPAATLLSSSPWLILELAMLMAGIAVYRFARTTDLPQVAERACWLWFFNPVLAMTVLDWGTQMAACFGTIAIAGIITRRPRLAALAAVIAVGCRLEFILIWPALAVAAWQHHQPGKDPAYLLGLGLAAIPVAFSAWIGAAWHLAGTADTSLRALHGEVVFRDSATVMPSSFPEVVVLLGAAASIFLALRYMRRFPAWYALCALPLLLWPFFHTPAHLAAITLAWSLPTILHLAVVGDDRTIERPLLTGLIIAYCLTLMTIV